MDSTPKSSRLRFLDADKLDDHEIDFDGMDVYGWEHEKLGDLDGFIVDTDSGRVYYAVINSGGWFSSHEFLLPMGHLIRYDADKRELHADLSKEALRDLPEYQPDRFSRFTDDELRTFETKTRAACCPGTEAPPTNVPAYDFDAHYREPAWWSASDPRARASRSEPARERRTDSPTTARTPENRAGSSEPYDRELVTARGEDEPATRGGETSPHPGGRAHPGDVVGVETGGERTHLGDTRSDEDKRRRDAETAAGRQRKE